MKTIKTHVGRKLSSLIKIELLMSQKEFANKINRPQEWLCRVIAGKVRLTAEGACQIAKATNTLALEWLYASARDQLNEYHKSQCKPNTVVQPRAASDDLGSPAAYRSEGRP